MSRTAVRAFAMAALAAWIGAAVECAILLAGTSSRIEDPAKVVAFALALGTPVHLLIQVALALGGAGARADGRAARCLRRAVAGVRGDPAAAAETSIEVTRGVLLCAVFAVGLAITAPIVLDSIVTPGYRSVAVGAVGLGMLLLAVSVATAIGPLVAWATHRAAANWTWLPVALVRLEAGALACAAAATLLVAGRVAPGVTWQTAGTTLGSLCGLALTTAVARRWLPPAWAAPVVLVAMATAAAAAPTVHPARTQAASVLPSVRAAQLVLWRAGTRRIGGGDPTRISAPAWIDLPAGTHRPRHVVFLSIDAVRADRLGCFGYRRHPTSPVIDDLARGGTLFTDAHAQGTTSLRSIPAAFLSRYPHTVPWLLYRSGRVMPDPTRTQSIAEVLRASGFRTLAVLHSRYLRNDGLMQGFDEIVSDPSGLDTRDTTTKLRAKRFVDQAIEYLDDNPVGDERLFLWMHFIDPHEPYNRVPGLDWGDSPPERYDAEIRYVDTQLGRFLAHLERRGIADDALFVLFSDHGEEFGEHGERFHGHSLNRIATHVPLLFWGRGIRPARHPGTVGLIDIMPTVLNMLSLRAPGLHGASLASSLLTRQSPPERTIVSELFPTRLSPPTGWSAERSGWKLLLGASQEPLALYRTAKDPAERRNAIALHPSEAAALRRDIATVGALP